MGFYSSQQLGGTIKMKWLLIVVGVLATFSGFPALKEMLQNYIAEKGLRALDVMY